MSDLPRLMHHFEPKKGWINDPNGLCFFGGKYHAFFQHYPFKAKWGPMHWGHCKTKDFVKWEQLPCALAPDTDYDGQGCFSGSAVEHEGKHILMYTSVRELETEDGARVIRQTQSIAVGDGLNYTKIQQNPVITADVLPEGSSSIDFRDPRIWKEGNTFYSCIGSRNADDSGQIALFSSGDTETWKWEGIIDRCNNRYGKMWECPDFYPMGDKYVLMFSPMGVGEHTSVYLVGDFDYQTGRFSHYISGEVDWGFDYYAPQSFLAPDGRRIIIGWANEWEWMPLWKDWGPTYKEGWCGFFNIPREVRMMENGTLQFLPVAETEILRQDPICQDMFVVTEAETELKAGDGVAFELKMKIDLEETDADMLELILRSGEGKKTVCLFDFKNAQMSVDRNASDGWSRGVSRSTMFLKGKKELDIHILSDQSSLEIFANEYQDNHANNIFAGNAQNRILIRTYGGRAVIREYESYGMKDCFRGND